MIDTSEILAGYDKVRTDKEYWDDRLKDAVPANSHVVFFDNDREMKQGSVVRVSNGQIIVKERDGATWQIGIHSVKTVETPAEAEARKDDESVDAFASALKNKLASARDKGRGGWEDKEAVSDRELADQFAKHLEKDNDGNFLDLAAFLMMLRMRRADPGVIKSVLHDGL